VYPVGEKDAGVLPSRSADCESVLDHPLPKALADDGPGIVDADFVAQPLPVSVPSLRRDSIDHRVRERAHLDVSHKLHAVTFGHGDDRGARNVTVAGHVVAAKNRQRGPDNATEISARRAQQPTTAAWSNLSKLASVATRSLFLDDHGALFGL
jgi:hypothetical protein